MKKSKMVDLEKVRLARTIIKSNLFPEDKVTQICRWLDFNDTAFRDKKAKDKLSDFLLDENYYLKKKKKCIQGGAMKKPETAEEILSQFGETTTMCWTPRISTEIFNPDKAGKATATALSQFKELVPTVVEIEDLLGGWAEGNSAIPEKLGFRHKLAIGIHNFIIEKMFGRTK